MRLLAVVLLLCVLLTGVGFLGNSAYPTDSLPARLNRIDVRFTISEQEFRYVRLELSAGIAAYEQGLRGAELLRELDKKE